MFSPYLWMLANMYGKRLEVYDQVLKAGAVIHACGAMETCCSYNLDVPTRELCMQVYEVSQLSLFNQPASYSVGTLVNVHKVEAIDVQNSVVSKTLNDR